MRPKWFGRHVAYTIAKYGMSMCALGMAEEFRGHDIAVNALWPKISIQTAASELIRGKESFEKARSVEIMADAAYAILSQQPRQSGTGQFLLDEDVLAAVGVTDLQHYACVPANANRLSRALFMDANNDQYDIVQLSKL